MINPIFDMSVSEQAWDASSLDMATAHKTTLLS